jgi:hypothetical protein
VTTPSVTLRDLLTIRDLLLRLIVNHVHLAGVLRLNERMNDSETLLRVANESNGVRQSRVLVRSNLELSALNADAFGNLLDLVDET